MIRWYQRFTPFSSVYVHMKGKTIVNMNSRKQLWTRNRKTRLWTRISKKQLWTQNYESDCEHRTAVSDCETRFIKYDYELAFRDQQSNSLSALVNHPLGGCVRFFWLVLLWTKSYGLLISIITHSTPEWNIMGHFMTHYVDIGWVCVMDVKCLMNHIN